MPRGSLSRTLDCRPLKAHAGAAASGWARSSFRATLAWRLRAESQKKNSIRPSDEISNRTVREQSTKPAQPSPGTRVAPETSGELFSVPGRGAFGKRKSHGFQRLSRLRTAPSWDASRTPQAMFAVTLPRFRNVSLRFPIQPAITKPSACNNESVRPPQRKQPRAERSVRVPLRAAFPRPHSLLAAA